MPSEAFRQGYVECRELLLKRLAEPAPGRIQLLSGPRQVGKTTLLLDMELRRLPELTAKDLHRLARYRAAWTRIVAADSRCAAAPIQRPTS